MQDYTCVSRVPQRYYEGALSRMLASMSGNLKAVEFASLQYTSPPTLYSTMAVLSRRIFGNVGFCMTPHHTGVTKC